MSIKLDDFIGFEWNGHHSSEFNLKVVSSGDRYDSRFLSEIKNNTVDIPGQDGQYFYNSTYGAKEWTINIAFDSVTETMQRDIENWLSSKELSDLTFDERPYKSYSAKLASRPTITWICFDEPKKTKSFEAPRIYKGEGTLNFIAPFPYACSVIGDNGKYMKFVDQFAFKKNPYIPPIQRTIQITDNAGGYINNGKAQILELNQINITPLSSTIQENNNYSFYKYTLSTGYGLQLAQGKTRINFINAGESDLTFQNCNGIRDSIDYNSLSNKYNYVQRTISKTLTFYPDQNRQIIYFDEDEKITWSDNTQENGNIMCAYPIDEVNNAVDYTVTFFPDSNYVQRFIVEFDQAFLEETNIEFLFTTEPEIIYTFSNSKIAYNLENGEGVSFIYIKNDNSEVGILKELVFNCYETMYYNLNEWLESSHLVNNPTDKPYDYCVQNGKIYSYPIVNSGDLAAPFELTIPLSNKKLMDKEIIVALADNDIVTQDFYKSITSYFDFDKSQVYYYEENGEKTQYYLLDKRIDNSTFILYFCDESGEETITLESQTGLFDNLYIYSQSNTNILKSFVLKFDNSISKEYSTILQNFAGGNKLVINTYKQTINLVITRKGNEISIPMHFLLSKGDLFKIPVSEFQLSHQENIKLDNYRILVYDNNSIIDSKIKDEELKYRFLYY